MTRVPPATAAAPPPLALTGELSLREPVEIWRVSFVPDGVPPIVTIPEAFVPVMVPEIVPNVRVPGAVVRERVARVPVPASVLGGLPTRVREPEEDIWKTKAVTQPRVEMMARSYFLQKREDPRFLIRTRLEVMITIEPSSIIILSNMRLCSNPFIGRETYGFRSNQNKSVKSD
jgi:hypothetical protein